ncbi:RecQ family ATP-dependent DNA helicase [Rothia sp. CCM 9419]|uniref:RecQ family ATP-dependent DNA helicase n=1 Tax=Rothia sp. CCM 9419 TaxID=3402662 RepID=UPI003AEA9194
MSNYSQIHHDELYTEAIKLLRKLTGKNDAAFHRGQYEAIEALVQHRRKALVIERTGWGKSAVYFIASLLMRKRGGGPALIISPLLALMRDQVQAAARAGVKAATINSSNITEWDEIRQQLQQQTLDVLLIGPERLNNPDFYEHWLPELVDSLGLLVIDEAHCISDWGHDFRPDYRRIREVIAQLKPNTPILATTATANQRVIEDIAEQLNYSGNTLKNSSEQNSDIFILRGPLSRDSLRLGVLHLKESTERIAWLVEHLKTLTGSGIIYTLTVSAAEDIAHILRNAGYAVQSYSGQMSVEERIEAEEALRHNTIKALVATSALGMGFDKPDMGFVIHCGAPSSLIAYYQQVGRAGRGTDNADVLLLPGAEDQDIWEYFATASMPTEENTSIVLNVLEKAREQGQTLTLSALETVVDIRRSNLELLLKVLAVEGAVRRVSNRWVATGAPWTYDAERYRKVAQTRQHEQEAMLSYISTSSCRMVYMAQQLDDTTATKCGRCDNCAGSWYPQQISSYAHETTRNSLQEAGVRIEPRRMWPSGLKKLLEQKIGTGKDSEIPSRAKIAEEERACQGRALARLTDIGWGNVLREIFKEDAEDVEVSSELGQACVKVLSQWDWQDRPNVVIGVPSEHHPRLAFSLARGLAQTGRLHDLGDIQLVQPTSYAQGNSVFRCAGVWDAYAIPEPMRVFLQTHHPSVLLVSDSVNSRWSTTVIARQLRRAGAHSVYPFALAIS